MIIVKNLTIYGNQPIGDIRSTPISYGLALNEALIERYKKNGTSR